ncbi:MAG: hypothetical protein WA138_15570, partial [Parvibaculum sp.]
LISPIFSSIEEWLGRNTPAYYEILAKTGQGSWHPQNDTHAWVQFCLKAHFQQAHTIVKRNDWFEKIYKDILEVLAKNKLPSRMYSALMDAALGLRIRAGRYREEHELSDVVASRDLRKLSNLELIIPHGERRGRYYTGSTPIKMIAAKYKTAARADDPYRLVREKNSVQDSPELPF